MKKRKVFVNLVLMIVLAICLSGCFKNYYNSHEIIESGYEIQTLPTETDINETYTNETNTEQITEMESFTEIQTETLTETESSTEIETQTFPPENTDDKSNEELVEVYISKMTLEEKVCQMFVIRSGDLVDKDRVVNIDDEIKEKLDHYPVGGFIFFSENLVDTEQTKNMLADLQECSVRNTGLVFFTCIDEEGGRVARIGNNKAFGVEHIGAMANVKNEMEAFYAGDTIGTYLSYLGFNFDFAPDADVITNPENKVIGDRSFGTNATTVSQYAFAYAKGLGEHDVLATYKHFPGHGGTVGDTHEGYAFTDKNLDELMQNELIPFIDAANNDVDAVMIAHISVPNILGDNTPCSLSQYMVTDVLREKLGYKGLILTDALEMKAVANEYSSSEAAIAAILAGNDIVLIPKDFYEAYEGVLDAVEKGIITEERIDESLRRIINAKLKIMK